MPWAAAVAGAAALGSAAISSSAAGSAASQQGAAATAANNFATNQLDRQIGNSAGYVSGGNQANNALLQLLGLSTGSNPNNGLPNLTGSIDTNAPLIAPFTQAQFQQSPGYQYQLGQTNNAILNNASALGGPLGGNTLMALQTNAAGLSNQDWYNAMNAYYGQQNSVFNKLSGVATTGLNATNAIAGVGTNISGQVGANTTGAGNAAAAGTVGQANALTSGLGNISQLAALFGGGSGSGPSGLQNILGGGSFTQASVGAAPSDPGGFNF